MSPTILKFKKPRHRQKMAMFDYDWTLVKPKQGRKFPKDADDWMWWSPNVPEVLKKYYEDGYALYVFTNQTKAWKKDHIMNSLSSLNIPITAVIAYDKAEHKPAKTMFDVELDGKKWKQEASFFVGDALGRAGDFANTDKLFGEAIGVTVKSPENFFLKKEDENLNTGWDLDKLEEELADKLNYKKNGTFSVEDMKKTVEYLKVMEGNFMEKLKKEPSDFNRDLVQIARYMIENVEEKIKKAIDKNQKYAEIVKPTNEQEIVVMAGFPGSGKSTLAKQFVDFGYDVIDGDVYKTEKARMKKAIVSLEDNKSVVFDATNLTREKRAVYVKLAKEFMIPVRVIYVQATMDEAYQNNLKRPKEKQVPLIAYRKLNKTFEEPVEEEGFELQTIQYQNIPYSYGNGDNN